MPSTLECSYDTCQQNRISNSKLVHDNENCTFEETKLFDYIRLRYINIKHKLYFNLGLK